MGDPNQGAVGQSPTYPWKYWDEIPISSPNMLESSLARRARLAKAGVAGMGSRGSGWGENGFEWLSNGFLALGWRVLYGEARDRAGAGKLLSGKELGEALGQARSGMGWRVFGIFGFWGNEWARGSLSWANPLVLRHYDAGVPVALAGANLHE